MYILIYLYIRIYVYMLTYAHTCTYIHVYIYTPYIHIYTYIQMLMLLILILMRMPSWPNYPRPDLNGPRQTHMFWGLWTRHGINLAVGGRPQHGGPFSGEADRPRQRGPRRLCSFCTTSYPDSHSPWSVSGSQRLSVRSFRSSSRAEGRPLSGITPGGRGQNPSPCPG